MPRTREKPMFPDNVQPLRSPVSKPQLTIRLFATDWQTSCAQAELAITTSEAATKNRAARRSGIKLSPFHARLSRADSGGYPHFLSYPEGWKVRAKRRLMRHPLSAGTIAA